MEMICTLSRLYIASCLLAMVFLLQCSVHCMDEVFLPTNPDGVHVINFSDEGKSENNHDVEKNSEQKYQDFLNGDLLNNPVFLCDDCCVPQRKCRILCTLQESSLKEAMAIAARAKGVVTAKTKGAVTAKKKWAKPGNGRALMSDSSWDHGVE